MTTARHITVSALQGMVTEVEIMDHGVGADQRYILRYHQTECADGSDLEMSIPDTQAESWSGFRYRNNEISVLLLSQGRSSTAA
jgi:hypothetical protein